MKGWNKEFMKQEINDLKKDFAESKNNIDNVYEFAIRQVEQNYNREKFIVTVLAFCLWLLILINGFLGYQLLNIGTVEETVEYKQNGEWNAIAEDGSVVNGDYTNGYTMDEENH